MIFSLLHKKKSVLQLATHPFINRKFQNLSKSYSPRNFWHLAKYISNNFTSSSIPPLFHTDGTTAISSVPKAELFSQTFAKKVLSLIVSCLQSKFFVMIFSMLPPP
ncbi:hypothetical protein E2C01_037162 [Portunus trituberculatus]|uniref:Uncharacterized protein n=1 Tax=Portunus trituberculatus TaxID=210409 RepID=A0A5B7FEJ4_PORTR|nr:hypothetical protein [Portunus trituberculatus]